MAYYEMMPAGLPAGLQSGMDSVLNKKFGTATSYAPGTWPDTVNLMGPLPEATVSGAIATLEDGADAVPCKNVVATIAPNLAGVSSVTVTQTGRNLLNYADIANSYRITSLTDNGGGSFTVVASGLGAYIDHVIKVKPCQAYSIKCTSATNDEGNASQIGVVNVYDGSDDTTTLLLNGASISTRKGFTPTGNYILVRNKVTGGSGAGTGTIVEPQLETGSTAHAYEPYTAPTTYTAQLGRTVYGGTADLVTGDGHSTRIKKTVRWGDLGNVTQLADVTRKEIVLSASETPKYITAAASTDLLNDKNLPYDMTYSGNFEHIYIANSARIWVYLPNGTDANTEITVSYTLDDALQTDFTFTGQEINTLLGVNNFWHDAGDTSVTYRRDIDLALQALSGSRGLMMARPQLDPETEPEETIEETPEEMER